MANYYVTTKLNETLFGRRAFMHMQRAGVAQQSNIDAGIKHSNDVIMKPIRLKRSSSKNSKSSFDIAKKSSASHSPYESHLLSATARHRKIRLPDNNSIQESRQKMESAKNSDTEETISLTDSSNNGIVDESKSDPTPAGHRRLLELLNSSQKRRDRLPSESQNGNSSRGSMAVQMSATAKFRRQRNNTKTTKKSSTSFSNPSNISILNQDEIELLEEKNKQKQFVQTTGMNNEDQVDNSSSSSTGFFSGLFKSWFSNDNVKK